MKRNSKLLFLFFLLFASSNIKAQDDECERCFKEAQSQMNAAGHELDDDVLGCAEDLLGSVGFWMDMIEAYSFNPLNPSGPLGGGLAASESMMQALGCLAEAQSDFNNSLDNAGDMLCACCPYTCNQ